MFAHGFWDVIRMLGAILKKNLPEDLQALSCLILSAAGNSGIQLFYIPKKYSTLEGYVNEYPARFVMKLELRM